LNCSHLRCFNGLLGKSAGKLKDPNHSQHQPEKTDKLTLQILQNIQKFRLRKHCCRRDLSDLNRCRSHFSTILELGKKWYMQTKTKSRWEDRIGGFSWFSWFFLDCSTRCVYAADRTHTHNTNNAGGRVKKQFPSEFCK